MDQFFIDAKYICLFMHHKFKIWMLLMHKTHRILHKWGQLFKTNDVVS